jgi:hypothetical protein
MVHVAAEPVRANALRPFARFHALRHFHHPTGGAQHQRHHRIGDGFGQHGRGMHQQHLAGVQRLDVEVVIANGNVEVARSFGIFSSSAASTFSLEPSRPSAWANASACCETVSGRRFSPE